MKRIMAAGTPRSGTTLLQQILMANPRGTSISETHFFNEVPEEDVLFADPVDGETIWNRLKEETHVQVLTNVVSPEVLEKLIENSEGRDELFFNIMDHYATDEQADYWVEKTPTHLARFPRLFKKDFNAKGVIIVRDPRDTCASLIDKPWTHDDIESNAKRWFADNTLAMMLEEALPDEIRLVHYRELVTNPDDIVRDLCDFLSIEFDEAMLHPENHAEELTFRWEEWKDNNYRPINDSAVGKYKKKLSDEQVNTVVGMTAPVSNRLLGTDFPVTPFWEDVYETVREDYEEDVAPLR